MPRKDPILHNVFKIPENRLRSSAFPKMAIVNVTCIQTTWKLYYTRYFLSKKGLGNEMKINMWLTQKRKVEK